MITSHYNKISALKADILLLFCDSNFSCFSVPLYFISEIFGNKVFWNDETSTVVISGSNAENSNDIKDENSNADINSGADNNITDNDNSSNDVRPALPQPPL